MMTHALTISLTLASAVCLASEFPVNATNTDLLFNQPNVQKAHKEAVKTLHSLNPKTSAKTISETLEHATKLCMMMSESRKDYANCFTEKFNEIKAAVQGHR